MLSQVINPDDQRGSRVCANQIGQGGVRSSSVGSSTIFFPFLCVCVCVQELKKKKKREEYEVSLLVSPPMAQIPQE